MAIGERLNAPIFTGIRVPGVNRLTWLPSDASRFETFFMTPTLAVARGQVDFLPLRAAGGTGIPYAAIHIAIEVPEPMFAVRASAADPRAVAIASHVAASIGDGATIETGLGKLPGELLRTLGDRRGGTQALYDALPDSRIVFRLAFYTHDAATIASRPNRVTINSATAVDLFGQSYSETAQGGEFRHRRRDRLRARSRCGRRPGHRRAAGRRQGQGPDCRPRRPDRPGDAIAHRHRGMASAVRPSICM